MIRSLNKIFLVLFFSLLPILALAQSGDAIDIGGTKYYPSFTPVPTDLSVSYLGQIFGTVGTVLHGTSGQMLGQLFKVFNIGILVLAGIFLVYTIFMTVLNTAHEGEFMGRKWNSAWIAIRTVLGLGLLVPSATTGYSTIQVIVMWVVIQGVGFANMAWYSALNYIKQGGSVYTPPSTDIASMVNLAGTVLEMQVCMYTAQNVAQNKQKNNSGEQSQQSYSASNTPILDFKPVFTASGNSMVHFPGNTTTDSSGQVTVNDQDKACGQIIFGAANDNKTDTIKAAIQQMMLDTDSYAQEIVNPTSSSSNQNFPMQVQGAIVGSAADFINVTLPIRAQSGGILDSLMSSFGSDAVKQGWIMAGRYYYALGNIQQQVKSATNVNVKIDVVPAGFDSSNNGSPISFSSLPKIDSNSMSGLNFLPTDKTLLVNNETIAATYTVAAVKTAQAVDDSNSINLNIGGAGILGFLLDPITSFLLVIVGELSSATGDPILVLQGMGYGFMALASTLWLVGTIGVFGLGTASSVLASVQPLGYGVEDAILAFIPTFTAFILIFFTMGATFAFYIPLIPFIIFVFSAVGWLIAVIEAMVAAPLVALGITHPEGHDLLGKSEQAIMLLLSVFLRPVLMVIGLIAGMIVSRVVIRFLNSGFFGIVFDVGDFNLFAFVAVLVVYCMLLMTIVNQSFSLIYIIPDRVMRWLGVSEQSTGAQEALQAAKGGFEQVAGGVEKLGQGVTSSGAQWKEKQMKKKEERDKLLQDQGQPKAKKIE